MTSEEAAALLREAICQLEEPGNREVASDAVKVLEERITNLEKTVADALHRLRRASELAATGFKATSGLRHGDAVRGGGDALICAS